MKLPCHHGRSLAQDHLPRRSSRRWNDRRVRRTVAHTADQPCPVHPGPARNTHNELTLRIAGQRTGRSPRIYRHATTKRSVAAKASQPLCECRSGKQRQAEADKCCNSNPRGLGKANTMPAHGITKTTSHSQSVSIPLATPDLTISRLRGSQVRSATDSKRTPSALFTLTTDRESQRNDVVRPNL